ncbi:WRKY Transcription Factor [Stylosanthes scabra]|uniref:WRKY Transcription Factor n=1 Tax=Stylosanthes scabra TaxID=79078 RepID=A0ABU6WHP4_9FABA|nr:WRKY Transcription Factor [Stylosanthes scabra]
MSSTAPSSFPQQLHKLDNINIMPLFNPHEGGAPTTSSSSSSMWMHSVSLTLGGSSDRDGAGPSTSKYGGGDYLVADMADVMFNSGNSSGNSMESLFPAADDDNWDPNEKKSS